MSVFVGDRQTLGVGRETTRGTGVSAALWVPAVEFDFQQRVNKGDVKGSQGKIISSTASKILQVFGQGNLMMDVRANVIGYFLLQLFGLVSSVNTTGSVYTHTFTLTHSNTHPTLSLILKDPNKCERFVRAALETLGLKFSADSLATAEIGLMSEPPADTTGTPDFTATDYLFAPSTVTFKLASAQSGLTGATAIVVNNLDLNFKKGADPDFGSGSNSPTDIYNTSLEITGSFERVFDGDTEHDYVFTPTNRALRFQMTDTAVNLGSGNNPSLTIDLYNVEFTEFSREVSLDNIVRQTVSFKGHIEQSSGNVMTATLVNTKSNYNS